MICVSVSQDVCPPPAEPSFPDPGPGPVLLLLSDFKPSYIPQQVSRATVRCLNCLQQLARRLVLQECKRKERDRFLLLVQPSDQCQLLNNSSHDVEFYEVSGGEMKQSVKII